MLRLTQLETIFILILTLQKSFNKEIPLYKFISCCLLLYKHSETNINDTLLHIFLSSME